jgi:hypothetical protein
MKPVATITQASTKTKIYLRKVILIKNPLRQDYIADDLAVSTKVNLKNCHGVNMLGYRHGSWCNANIKCIARRLPIRFVHRHLKV